ncbi:MAG: hypothetical protein NT155_04705 [Candidatus Staskawiczbacteria bacterium]|nr:hypothetical protein [Candidatus Staskawiczbacteria bacterium]
MENSETRKEQPEGKKAIMKIVCAWCRKEIGEKEVEGESGITHGICDECLQKHLPKK